jgi:cell division transport system permease protein
MKGQREKSIVRRLRSSYATTVISITLVIFLIGLMGLLLLTSKKLSDYVKENIGFSVFLNDNVKEADIIKLQKDLDATPYVKSTEYVPKEKAAQELQADLGEDFIQFLGYNPLLSSIDVRFFADYANADSIALIEKEFKNYPQIKEVYFQKNLIHLVNENIKKISLIILIFSGLLFFISIALINNTIRLSIYARRFTINTMQLVGATRSFIRKPFLIKSMVQGLISSAIALLLLVALIYYAQKEMYEVISLKDVQTLAILTGIVVVLGVVIALLSTYFAVNRYLRTKTNELYY